MTRRSSIETQIAEVEYELAQRRKVYPRLDAKDRSGASQRELHMRIMEDVLATLAWLKENRTKIAELMREE